VSRRDRNRAGAALLVVTAAVVLMVASWKSPPPPPPNASRTATFSRESTQETLRNPQISSGLVNRFLYTLSPSELIAGGGNALSDPGTRGYGPSSGPPPLWLTNGGRVEWAERDLNLRGVGLPLTLDRIFRGSVTGYDGPLGGHWEFNWNKRLYEEGDSDVVFHDMGRTETYDESSGSYTSPAGRYDTLAKDTSPDPDVFTRTDKYGVVETYEDEGSGWYRLTEIEDLNGCGV
jgi:hypothetical protein